MAHRRVHVIAEGRVQGVFFRAYTREEALKNGLCGWVRNRADGAVEAEIEGESGAVERMTAWLAKGSPAAIVSRLQWEERPALGTENDFVVRY